jgi:hypothetical protein
MQGVAIQLSAHKTIPHKPAIAINVTLSRAIAERRSREKPWGGATGAEFTRLSYGKGTIALGYNVGVHG